MVKNKPDTTAVGAAATRMMELYYPKEIRLFEDHLAKDLLNQPIKFITGLNIWSGIRDSFTSNLRHLPHQTTT